VRIILENSVSSQVSGIFQTEIGVLFFSYSLKEDRDLF